jgi:phosphoadenosine phosphosulfate reductase
VAFSSSLGEEDQLLTHIIAGESLDVRVFTLDTGRLFPESYELLQLTRSKYKLNIETFFPNAASVEALVNAKGPMSFYNSVENRKECCRIRKVEPLKRALEGVQIWVTGLRAAQSESRSEIAAFEWDSGFNLIKFNPLRDWSLEEVKNTLDLWKVPRNSLHAKGFVSIGCAPCTRAILPGEEPRSGRWWWEESKKECGLHNSN